MQILVIDSNASARQNVETLLDEWGYTFRSAEDGLKAWKLFQSEKFELVISEYTLPGMNGAELCRSIRNFERSQNEGTVGQTHFILCSTSNDPKNIHQAMSAGTDDYIFNPFEPAELRARVETAFRLLNLERCLATTNAGMKSGAAQAELALTTMLPAKRNGPDIRIEWLFHPSENIGGTLFNVLSLDASHIAIYALDVAGNGLAASLFALTLGNLMIPRHHIDEMAGPGHYPQFLWNKSPVSVVTTLNDRFLLTYPTNIYSTLFYGVYNVKTLTLRWVRAGYPPPILTGGERARVLDEGDPPVGLFPGFTYTEHITKLAKRDRLFLYSEGITSSTDPQMETFGAERLLSLAEKIEKYALDDVVAIISGTLQDHHRSDSFEDDIGLLAIEIL